MRKWRKKTDGIVIAIPTKVGRSNQTFCNEETILPILPSHQVQRNPRDDQSIGSLDTLLQHAGFEGLDDQLPAGRDSKFVVDVLGMIEDRIVLHAELGGDLTIFETIFDEP